VLVRHRRSRWPRTAKLVCHAGPRWGAARFCSMSSSARRTPRLVDCFRQRWGGGFGHRCRSAAAVEQAAPAGFPARRRPQMLLESGRSRVRSIPPPRLQVNCRGPSRRNRRSAIPPGGKGPRERSLIVIPSDAGTPAFHHPVRHRMKLCPYICRSAATASPDLSGGSAASSHRSACPACQDPADHHQVVQHSGTAARWWARAARRSSPAPTSGGSP